MILQQCKYHHYFCKFYLHVHISHLLFHICAYIFFYIRSFWILPSLMLKKMVMGNFMTRKVDEEIIDSIDFMVDRV